MPHRTHARLPLFVALLSLPLLLGGCVAAPYKPPPVPGADGKTAIAAPVLTGKSDPSRLQSELMALADTAISRIANETTPQRLAANPERRRALLTIRLGLATAMFGIVTGPDPVDGLLDMLTHTTLVADSLRRASEGKPPDSAEARMYEVAKRNDVDAWALAARYLDEPTRKALHDRIMLAADREGGAFVTAAYTRLSDLPRSGTASIDSGDGVFDTMRAATQQADQLRLLGERSLFLIQRMPYLTRWQAEAFANELLERQEFDRLFKQLDALTVSANQASKVVAMMPATIAKEREAALDDLFIHIRDEREATLKQLAEAVRVEREATLKNIADVVAQQRQATVADLTGLAGDAESRGSAWIGIVLLVGVLLIAVLLGGLLGTVLLYRRLAPKIDRA